MAAPGWRRKFAVFLPSVLVILLVLGEGTQRFSIQNTAGYVAPFWFRHFGSLPFQRFWEFVEALRKLGHLIGYGVVCLAFFGPSYGWVGRRPSAEQFRNYWGLKKIARCGFPWEKTTKRPVASVHTNCETAVGGWAWKNRAAGLALILTLMMGSADELHQRYVPQRTSTITDVGFDVCGGYFALMILFAALRLRERRMASQSAPKAQEHAAV